MRMNVRVGMRVGNGDESWECGLGQGSDMNLKSELSTLPCRAIIYSVQPTLFLYADRSLSTGSLSIINL